MEEDRIMEAFDGKMKIFADENGDNFFTLAIRSMNVKKILATMKFLSSISEEELSDIAEFLPLNDILSQRNGLVEPLIHNAMIPVNSIWYIEVPTVFNQPEDEIVYAESPQNTYDYDVQQQLHSETRNKKSASKIEIETLRSSFKIADRTTPESVYLKESIISCNKPDVYRTYLV